MKIMKIEAINPYYFEVFESFAAMQGGLWEAERTAVLAARNKDFTDTDAMLAVMHGLQRLWKIFTAGLENDVAFRAAVDKECLALWRDFTAPPASLELQHALAAKLYNIRPSTKDVGFISLGISAREIGRWLVEKCIADKVPFLVQFSDPSFDALVLNHASDENIKKLATAFVAMTARANRRMAAASGMAEKDPVKANPAKDKLYQAGVKPYGERIRSGDMFFTLTVIPTRRDAEIDGLSYEEYTRLFFEMCDQPWEHITRAQAALIKELDAGKTLRMTNSDGTDVSMSIEGFTFCNSVIAKNVPGSEVFSAPRRDSVNGKVVAKGRFIHDREVIENLTMEFENGHLVRWHAEHGQDAFEHAINLDEGARWVGEIGIGTNPHLKRHVANGLLVEKIGGSFHLALGAAYTLTEYAGVPVHVDNGNSSTLHWDITTMLHGKEGRMYLDGRLI
ncbi:MAG TPA: aminopeptidase, partial [Alphaproteobacteria bacterium]